MTENLLKAEKEHTKTHMINREGSMNAFAVFDVNCVFLRIVV